MWYRSLQNIIITQEDKQLKTVCNSVPWFSEFLKGHETLFSYSRSRPNVNGG